MTRRWAHPNALDVPPPARPHLHFGSSSAGGLEASSLKKHKLQYKEGTKGTFYRRLGGARTGRLALSPPGSWSGLGRWELCPEGLALAGTGCLWHPPPPSTEPLLRLAHHHSPAGSCSPPQSRDKPGPTHPLVKSLVSNLKDPRAAGLCLNSNYYLLNIDQEQKIKINA